MTNASPRALALLLAACALAPSLALAAPLAASHAPPGPKAVELSPAARKALLSRYDELVRSVTRADAAAIARATYPPAMGPPGGEVDWTALGWVGKPVSYRQLTGEELGWQGAAGEVRRCVEDAGARIQCVVGGRLSFVTGGRLAQATEAVGFSADRGGTWTFVAADARALPPDVEPSLGLRPRSPPAPLDARELGLVSSAHPLFDGCVPSAPAATVRRYECPGFLAQYEVVLEPLEPARVLELARASRQARATGEETEEPVTLRLAGREVPAVGFRPRGAPGGEPVPLVAVVRDAARRPAVLTCIPGMHRPTTGSCPAVLEYLASRGLPEELGAWPAAR